MLRDCVMCLSKEVTVAGTGKAVAHDTKVFTCVTVDDILRLVILGWLKLHREVDVVRNQLVCCKI
jgi:hypothetical protein